LIQLPGEWFEKLDELNSEPFLPGGRHQSVAPKRSVFK
jgi:hypothetical protein